MNQETKNQEVDHANRDHAKFSPSSLKYLAKCAGYHGRDSSSSASEMGTRIHEALEVRDPSALQSEEELSIYDQLLQDEEEVFAYVFSEVQDVHINREMRLHIELDAKTPTFGTCDIVALDPRVDGSGVALVADYKTGISFIDPPRGNWQAKAYTLGVFQKYPHIKVIHFSFLVPRNGGVITGTFERSEMGSLRDEISAVVRKAEVTRPKWDLGTIDIDDLNPTVNCRFCRHEETCPALGAVAIGIAARLEPGLLPNGPIRSSDVEDPEVLSQLFKVARIVENWAGSIKFKALSVALAGQALPGLKVKSMGTPLKIEDNVNAVNVATREFGVSIDDVLQSATLSLSKLAGVVSSAAPRGQKGKAADRFRERVIDLGVAVETNTRFTLVDDNEESPTTEEQE